MKLAQSNVTNLKSFFVSHPISRLICDGLLTDMKQIRAVPDKTTCSYKTVYNMNSKFVQKLYRQFVFEIS